MFRQQRSGTTSGSSPSFSDANDASSPPWKEAVHRTIDGSTSSPLIAGSITTNTTLSPFTTPDYSSSGMELDGMQTAYMPGALPHDANMELINITSALTAIPMAKSGNAVLSPPLSHFEWQPMLEHSSTTMPTQFGPPISVSFDTPFRMPSQDVPHQPSHHNGNTAFDKFIQDLVYLAIAFAMIFQSSKESSKAVSVLCIGMDYG
ncbi:hypothetical protein PRZ48_009793 [Zasmidium cellare]|uniref:Uncharacterized protein n=1 Tax=Zasmidium cellare TaxID=395010 RepID=A0ABR0ECP6_ZASCE|nr:hypothetical protein PRZ48_009793 [Zasmidium cellare]